MDIQTGLEGLEQQAQKDNSPIDSFLQNLENKDSIIKVINTENFYNDFENFLTNSSTLEKRKLQKELQECKSENEIKSILIEHLFNEIGYNISDVKTLRDIEQQANEDNQQANEDNQQANEDNQQANEDNQQVNEDEQQANEDNQQANEDNQQANEDNQQANEDNQQANEDNQQANEDNQQANEDEQQTINNEQQNIEIVSGLKEMEDAISARQELVNKIPDLDKKTNKDSELYQSTKSELEQNGTIQQLKDSNHDENFINNYILVHTTLKELKQNENYKDVNISFFEKAVKNLDNACNIPDTKFDNFSKENIAKTRTELFDTNIGNHSLKEAKKVNEKLDTHKNRYNEIFALDEDKDINTQLIEKYGKFVKDDDLNNLIKKYENNELSEQDGDTLKKGLESIKNDIDNQTKDLIEEMCLIAPIQGIFACIGPELGNNFELNKSREISNENGEVTITGHIDGIQFSLHHDTSDPDAHLQTSSILTNINNNKFEIGEKFENSPYKLPTNGDIFAAATSCLTDGDITANNARDYFKELQGKISEKIENELYKNAKYANHYIKDKIKGEKISNQYLDLLGQIKGSPLSGDIEQSNSKLYNFIDLINSTNHISTPSEKGNIIKCLETIQNIISTHGKTDKQASNYPEIIRHFLMKKKVLRRTKKILKGYDISGESIFDLFGYYTEQNSGIKIINFKQLQKDLEGQESLVASMRKDDKDKGNADLDLNNAIEKMT